MYVCIYIYATTRSNPSSLACQRKVRGDEKRVCVCSVWAPCVLCGPPWGPVCPVWAPCGVLPSGGLPPFGVAPPVLIDSLRARRAALRTAHAQRSGILAKTSPQMARTLAFTRYCHYQYGMVYGIRQGGRGVVVYWAIDVQ